MLLLLRGHRPRSVFLILSCLVAIQTPHKTRRNIRSRESAASLPTARPVDRQLPLSRETPRVLIPAAFHRRNPDPPIDFPGVAPEMSRPDAHVDQLRELIGGQHRRGL